MQESPLEAGKLRTSSGEGFDCQECLQIQCRGSQPEWLEGSNKQEVPRVVGGAGDNQGSEGLSSDSDSISHELNKAMDIDALISNSRKRHRTLVGATRVNPSSEGEKSGSQLEHCQKKRANYGSPVVAASTPITITKDTPPSHIHESSLVAPIAKRVSIEVMEGFLSSLRCLLSKVVAINLRYVKAYDKELVDTQAKLKRVGELYNKVREENEIINEQQGVLIECLAMMETKADVCRAELVVEKERRIIAEVELKKVTNISGSLPRLKENLLLHTQVVCGPFAVRKVDFDVLAGVNVSSLGFDAFNPIGDFSSSFSDWRCYDYCPNC
ncbi:hypothetical protein J1N35_028965 [Gossypium stocksii]|uniref:Uncharacterized protein n=1 Tax=Gossypium stocksii TaxID=47602 RepID=A0A9D3UX70_9ROSI|nr:hypothetical protein J1N35_028965 [Gossypium stocksii]